MITIGKYENINKIQRNCKNNEEGGFSLDLPYFEISEK
jgi:hypothetical protein